LFQIFPERFFQLVTGMIRTDRHRRRLAPGQAARRTIALIDEPQIDTMPCSIWSRNSGKLHTNRRWDR